MIDGRHIGILLPISIFTYSLCVIICMSIMLHPPAKFRRNRTKTSADFWPHIDLSRGRSWSRKSTSEFRFSYCFRSKWWKSMCIPNLDEIPQSTVEIKLLTVWENGRSPYWNSISCFNFDPRVVIGMWFCISMPNFVSIRRSPAELWHNIDFWRWRP